MYTSSELLRCAENNKLFAPYFCGIYSVDNLPLRIYKSSLPAGYILNTDTANLPGKHWIAVTILTNGRGEVFDSFGLQPPQRLQLWLNKHCLRGWRVNSAHIQDPFSTHCGAYCLYFLYSRLVLNHSFDDIIDQLLACGGENADSFVLRQFKIYFSL